MTLTICFGRPICWRPRLARGWPFIGWRLCWLVVAIAWYPMQDKALFEKLADGGYGWWP